VSLVRLPASGEGGQKIETSTVARAGLAPRRKPHYEWRYPAGYRLGQIVLRGFDLTEASLHPGGALHLRLYWQALASVSKNYTVFIHFIDADGKVWAQQDTQPAQGSYPTGAWAKDEIVEDVHDVPLPTDLPTGHYHLALGMYLLETMERLPASNDAGTVLPDNRIILWEGTVGPIAGARP
jgi:hypothetical protein